EGYSLAGPNGQSSARPASGGGEGHSPAGPSGQSSAQSGSGDGTSGPGSEGPARSDDDAESGGAAAALVGEGADGGRGVSPAGAPGPGWPGGGPWWPSVTGSINLTLPLSAYLGLSDAPGEVGGHGAADADTCRDIAAWL